MWISAQVLLMESYNVEPWGYNWTFGQAVEYLNEYFDRKRFVGFVLCEDDDIVGAMFGHSKTWWTDDLLYIDELFVSPQRAKAGLWEVNA